MREKKEILKVFDVAPALAGNAMDVVRGLGALCEVLCDIRDVVDKLPHLKSEDLSLYRIPGDSHDEPSSLPEPPGKDGKWND